MGSILYEMSASITRYVAVLSRIMKMAVTVVDDQQIRIVYEGKWQLRADAGQNMAERGHIVKTVLDTGEAQMMLEPHGHPACANCDARASCKDCLEMWAPITVGGKVLGVIGFNSETQRQRQHILKNCDTFRIFLQQFAELIAFEALHTMETKKDETVIALLETVIDRLDSGVMILSKKDEILRLNKMGRSILQDTVEQDFCAEVSVSATGQIIAHMEEYRIQAGLGDCMVAGKLYEVNVGPYSRVLLFNDAERMRGENSHKSAFPLITGSSQAIELVRQRIKTAAASSSSVLLCAEVGLGKELYARAIHDESEARDKPFIRVDCSAFPDRDPESYLFGTTVLSNIAGTHGKPGRIEAAAGGTLFLENIEALPMPLQQRLICLLDRREITRVGSKKPRRILVRVIASTDKDLREACVQGNFDRGLYYLISVIPITIPPLRNRREDIRLLAINFLNLCAKELGKTLSGEKIQAEFWCAVERYDWPGNVRELRNAMEYVVNMMTSSETVSAALLPERIQPPLAQWLPPQINLAEAEAEIIRHALQLHEMGAMTKEEIAQKLGIGTATLYRKIKKYRLN